MNGLPYRCPVCGGNGLVPNGFYCQVGGGGWPSLGTDFEKCRSCDGTGIVWEQIDPPGPIDPPEEDRDRYATD